MAATQPGAAASISEKDWQAQVLELAGYYRWGWYHTYDSRRSAPGWPDLVLVRPPEIIYVELKTNRGRLSRAQRAWLAVLEDCGQEIHVWRPRDFEAVHGRLKRLPAHSGENGERTGR